MIDKATARNWDLKRIGKAIHMGRVKADMSIEDLAAKMKVSPRTAQGWEAGRDMPVSRLLEVMEVIEIDWPYLFTWLDK